MALDGRSTVAEGQVGTGAAQVFDTSAPVNRYFAELDKKSALELRRQQDGARRRQEQRKASKIDLKPAWDRDTDYIMGLVDAIYAADEAAYAAGQDITDTRNPYYKIRQKKIREVEQATADSLAQREIYLKTGDEYNKNKDKYDQEYYENIRDQWDNPELNVEDRRKLNPHMLLQKYDFYTPLKDIDVGDVLKSDEDRLGGKDTYKNRRDDPDFKNAIQEKVDNWLGDVEGREHYENGLAKGKWQNTDEHEEWVKKEVVNSMPLEERKKAAKASKNKGSGKTDDDYELGYKIDYSDSPGGGTIETVALKNNRVWHVTETVGGKEQRIIPIGFDREKGGEIMIIAKAVPEGGGGKKDDDIGGLGSTDVGGASNASEDEINQYETVRISAKMNRHVIESNMPGFDVEKFMDKKFAEESANVSKTDETVLEDMPSTPASPKKEEGKSLVEKTENAVSVLTDLTKDIEGVSVVAKKENGLPVKIEIEQQGGKSKVIDLDDPDTFALYEKVRDGKADVKLLLYK